MKTAFKIVIEGGASQTVITQPLFSGWIEGIATAAKLAYRAFLIDRRARRIILTIEDAAVPGTGPDTKGATNEIKKKRQPPKV